MGLTPPACSALKQSHWPITASARALRARHESAGAMAVFTYNLRRLWMPAQVPLCEVLFLPCQGALGLLLVSAGWFL
jgi:hypothetical protein